MDQKEINKRNESTMGFTCHFCEQVQEIPYLPPMLFPVCDQCKEDLKEIILTKRNGLTQKKD